MPKKHLRSQNSADYRFFRNYTHFSLDTLAHICYVNNIESVFFADDGGLGLLGDRAVRAQRLDEIAGGLRPDRRTPMAHGKVAEYDDEVLVEMLAGGSHTYAQIAEELDLSEGYVAKVGRGERRPELQPRLTLIQRARRAEAMRLGARYARSLLLRHIRAGLAGDSETARKCREFALRECCFRPERRASSESAAERYAYSRMLEPLAPWANTEAVAELLKELDDSDGRREQLKDSTPQKSHPADGFGAEKSPIEPAAEPESCEALAQDAPAAKGCV